MSEISSLCYLSRKECVEVRDRQSEIRSTIAGLRIMEARNNEYERPLGAESSPHLRISKELKDTT